MKVLSLRRYNSIPWQGFSLVEMLVSLGIVCILTAIIISVVSRAQRSAKTIQSLTNLRNIGQAVQFYLADNQNRFPPLGREGGFKWPLWTSPDSSGKTLDQYLPASEGEKYYDFKKTPYSINAVFVDPTLSSDRHHSIGDYGANFPYIFAKEGEEKLLTSIPSPSRVVMVTTASDNTAVPPTGTWYIETYNWVNGGGTSVPAARSGSNAVPMLFVDGHVEQIDAARLGNDLAYRRSLFIP